jgi:hypothetical protein
MEKDERQSGGPEQEAGNREPQRASRPAPGKVTRTSRLSSGRGPAVQRKAAAPDAGAEAPPARSAWDHTMDPSMDAAHRGVTALVERGQEPVQQSAMHVMRRASSSAAPSADAAQALAAADGRSGSAPDAAIREKVEATTGADLSSVRVHTGGASQKAAAAVQAKAYTVGSDIHFAAGQYNPTSPAGGELLAHELVHTVQQSGGQGAAQLKSVSVSQPGDAAEREADRIAHAAVSGQSERMAPTERAAPVARAPETLNGNPNELTDNTGANRTTHRSPTLSDSVNAPTATPAASETRAANVKIVAEEASPLHLEPPATPVSSLVYEEADAAQSPAPSGFTTISGFNGTVAAQIGNA